MRQLRLLAPGVSGINVFELGLRLSEVSYCRGDRERVNGVTTTRFSGFVGLMDPQRSWVARYQRLPHTYAQAVYAVQTKGVLPDDVQEILEDRGYAGMRPEGSSQE